MQAELIDDEPTSDRTKELAAEYKSLVIANLQKRDAWQVIDTVEKMTDPSDAGRLGRLGAVPDQRAEA